jgi:hypothetical protein
MRVDGQTSGTRRKIAQSSVAKYIVERGGPPSQGWRTFLRNHAPDIAAIGRRDLVWINVWINVAANPTAEWVARQTTEAFPGMRLRTTSSAIGIGSMGALSHADFAP